MAKMIKDNPQEVIDLYIKRWHEQCYDEPNLDESISNGISWMKTPEGDWWRAAYHEYNGWKDDPCYPKPKVSNYEIF